LTRKSELVGDEMQVGDSGAGRSESASWRKSKLSVAIAMAAGLVLSLVPSAQAHVVVRRDYNDSASPLDLESAGFLHTRDFYVSGVRTFSRFRNGALGRRGDIYVDLDSRGGPGADYYVALSMRNSRLSARLYAYSGSTSYFVGRGVAWRPDSRMVMFGIRRNLVRRSSDYLRYYGSSRYQRGVDSYGKVLFWWDRTSWKTHSFR